MLEDHLGGHNGLTHTDEGALRWAIKNLQVKTMLDIGCGPGGQVELANSIGIDAHGVDGDYTLKRYDENKFTIHDFTNGPAPITKTYDLTWSCEFVEHVYEEYVPNFAKTMAQSKYMIMTYAPVGHTGYHHVNCNTEEYWINTMADYGFIYNKRFTKDMRKHSTMGKKTKHQFVKRTGLFFRNEQR